MNLENNLSMKILYLSIIFCVVTSLSCKPFSQKERTIKTTFNNFKTALLKEGDVIFHETQSPQARAIKLATKSRYSHVGVIFIYKKRWFVLEAIQPVKITPLNRFIRRGVKRHFVIKRLKAHKTLLTKKTILCLKRAGSSMIGKNYDIYFNWSNKRIYCSELIWKMYKKCLGIEIGKLEKLKDFDLSHPYVKKIMKQRYGNRIPYNEPVISPESMFRSSLFFTIYNIN
jgi:uncharacterized protein YycO